MPRSSYLAPAFLSFAMSMVVAQAAVTVTPGSAVRSSSIDEVQTVDLPHPKGSDPLTPSEVARIRRLADGSEAVRGAKARAGGPQRTDHLQTIQFLYAERNDDRKASDVAERRANAFYYDYSKDEVLKLVVDLRSGTLHEQHRSPVTAQPTVTSAETRAGMLMVLADPQLGPSLRSIYRQLSGHDLTDVDQLRAQGGIFFHNLALGTPLADITGACEHHRCVQFFIPYDDKSYIDATNLVVDLSARQVLWVDQGLKAHLDASVPDDAASQ